jgi:tagatose-1,6-bisphosphate aldolase
LLFSYRAFNVAEKSDKSFNKHIKENLSHFELPQILGTASKKRTHLSLAKKVEAKVADFDIRGTIKLLSSDDSLASFNEDVVEELKKNILHHLANFFSQTLLNQRLLFNSQ